jgi:hypothetical protein
MSWRGRTIEADTPELRRARRVRRHRRYVALTATLGFALALATYGASVVEAAPLQEEPPAGCPGGDPGPPAPGTVCPSLPPCLGAGTPDPIACLPDDVDPIDVPTESGPVGDTVGIGSLMPAPDIRHGAAPSLTESYPPSAYQFDTKLGSKDVSDKVLNKLANSVFFMTVAMGVLTTRLFQWAFSVDLLTNRGTTSGTDSVVTQLAATIYDPWLPAMLAFAGLYLAWVTLIKRRTSEGVEGIVWLVAAGALAAWLFASPGSILTGAAEATTGVSRTILAGVSSVTPEPDIDDGTTVVMGDSPEAADTALRTWTDAWWRTFVYQPWCVGEVGDLRAFGHEHCQAILEAKTNGNLDDYYDDNIQGNEPYSTWYVGKNAEGRIGIALLSGFVAFVAGLLILVVALAVLAADLAALFLILISPVVFLLGINPGTRRIVLRWLELVLGALMKRIVYAAVLAVLLAVLQIIASYAGPIGYGLLALLQIAAIAVVIMYRQPLLNVFGSALTPSLTSSSGDGGRSGPGVMSMIASGAAFQAGRNLFSGDRNPAAGAGLEGSGDTASAGPAGPGGDPGGATPRTSGEDPAGAGGTDTPPGGPPADAGEPAASSPADSPAPATPGDPATVGTGAAAEAGGSTAGGAGAGAEAGGAAGGGAGAGAEAGGAAGGGAGAAGSVAVTAAVLAAQQVRKHHKRGADAIESFDADKDR